VAASNGRGRTITLHPQEALLQRARAFQESEAFGEYRKRRQASEHRLARLVQLGIRKARYFGHVKTLFQLLLAATVANLTLVATKLGMMGGANREAASFFGALYQHIVAIAKAPVTRLAPAPLSTALSSSLVQKALVWARGYRPDF